MVCRLHFLPWTVAATLASLSCAKVSAPLVPAPEPCALIVTDDDIPSGHGEAGALYMGTDTLGRTLLTADVVAVALGFRDAGLACVEVVDSHDGAIDPGPLDDIGVPLLTPSNTEAWTWPFVGSMVRTYTVAALVGYHSNAGEPGFRPHTVNDSIRRLRIGGETVGEVAALALGLGAFGVPVVLVSGDHGATREALDVIPGVEGVTVRWFDESGDVAFLESEEAGQHLRAAAARGARAGVTPWKPDLPLDLELSTWSAELMGDRAGDLGETWRRRLGGDPESHPEAHDPSRLLAPGVFDAAMVLGHRLRWQVDEPLTGFVSIVHAAAHMRPASGAWEHVSTGYEAWKADRPQEAIAAYEEALRHDRYDVATRCRLGAALEDAGESDTALVAFRTALERLDEVGHPSMKVWCVDGAARLELAAGNLSSARRAALQLLALPDSGTSHALGREVLFASSGGPALPVGAGLEGFFHLEVLDTAFLEARGVPVEADIPRALGARVGKLVLSRGEAVLTEAEFVREQERICGLPHRQVFNQRKCEALDDAICNGTTCRYQDYGNCSGLFYQRGVFVTAAHCMDGLTGSPDRLDRTRIVRFQRGPLGWTRHDHPILSIVPLKHFGEAWLSTEEGQVDVAVVHFDDPGEVLPELSIAPVPGPGEPIWMIGYPRSRVRGEEAMAMAGYGNVHGELTASFGRVVDANRLDATLCSTTGRQDDWELVAPCPRGVGTDEDGEPTPTGPITGSPFLSSVDTMNGYSGAPVFDSLGRWIGVNSTVYGADPRPAYLPEMRTVHIQTEGEVAGHVLSAPGGLEP